MVSSIYQPLLYLPQNLPFRCCNLYLSWQNIIYFYWLLKVFQFVLFPKGSFIFAIIVKTIHWKLIRHNKWGKVENNKFSIHSEFIQKCIFYIKSAKNYIYLIIINKFMLIWSLTYCNQTITKRLSKIHLTDVQSPTYIRILGNWGWLEGKALKIIICKHLVDSLNNQCSLRKPIDKARLEET